MRVVQIGDGIVNVEAEEEELIDEWISLRESEFRELKEEEE